MTRNNSSLLTPLYRYFATIAGGRSSAIRPTLESKDLLPNLAAMFFVIVVIELMLSILIARGFVNISLLPLGVRSFLAAYVIVVLAITVFAWGTLAFLALHTGYYHEGIALYLKFVRRSWPIILFLLFLFYTASWATFWQTGSFLDHHSLIFWATQPIQVFHWIDADVTFVVIGATLVLTFAVGRWVPSRVQHWQPTAKHRLLLTWGATVGLSLYWALFGELYSNRGLHRYSHQGSLYAVSRDHTSTPLVHLFAHFRGMLWKSRDEIGLDNQIQIINRPIISMNDYLASAKHSKVNMWNVIILMIESLRADQLRVYGGNREVMPAVEALGHEGRVFLNAYSQATHTNYAIQGSLSSHYPLRSATAHIYPKNPTYPRVLLYDILKSLGYHTAVFSSSNENWSNMIDFLETGNIDHFFHAPIFTGPTYVGAGDTIFANWVRSTKQAGSVDDRYTVKEAIEWIDLINGEPFFIYMNLQNSHLPYTVPADFARRFSPKELNFTIRFGHFPKDKVESVKDLYADSLAYVDAQIARLFEHLRRRGLWDRTLIVVTGDHGQAFYEHGFTSHGSQIYNEVMKVPLIFRAPELHPGIDHRPAQHIDVPPTILNLLGLPPHPSFQGIDLLQSAFDGNRSMHLISQTALAYQYGIVRARWKLIYDEPKRSYILYDLVSDPMETTDLARDKPEIARELAKKLNTWRTLQINYHADKNLHANVYPPVLKD